MRCRMPPAFSNGRGVGEHGREHGAIELISLLTHLGVFIRGLGGIMKVMPLPRGRRSGLGLVLMALAMTILALGRAGGLVNWLR